MLLDRATLAPDADAAAVRVTVQVEPPGLVTAAAEQLSDAGTGGAVRLRVVDWLSPLRVAVRVAL